MNRLIPLLLPLILLVSACAPQAKVVRPDWQNPSHKLVNDQIVPLLQAAGRNPAACKVFFIDSEKINALSAGECRFGFTMGLVNTGDAQFIRGIAAHEVAHEVLGHADKRKAAIATEQIIRTGVSLIPGVGGLIATSAVLVAGMLALPAYSRSQEAEADSKAVEILRSAKEPDSAGTMAYSFRRLLAHAGAKGGGLLDSHPGTAERLDAMLALQRQDIAAVTSSGPTTAAGPTLGTEVTSATPAAPSPTVVQPADTAAHPSAKDAVNTDRSAGGNAARTSPPIANETAMVAPGPRKVQSAGQITDLGLKTDIRSLGHGNQSAVVLIYQEGSSYSERVEGYLHQVAGRFADRAVFFRVEVSAADLDLIGPEPRTTPILCVVQDGRERARITGLPTRIAGKSPEEALADWLAEHLDPPTD